MKATTAPGIRIAAAGQWIPPELADALALQRAEEPESPAILSDSAGITSVQELPDGQVDFIFSTTAYERPGWVCQPLRHDRLAVAVADRSHLLAYREVPQQVVLKEWLLWPQSVADEPWCAAARPLFEKALPKHKQVVATFEMAMTLVAAGYGVTLAPASRLADYRQRGVTYRPLANTAVVVMTYLIHPLALTDDQKRFVKRVQKAFSAPSNTDRTIRSFRVIQSSIPKTSAMNARE